jgi:hypothetical protein
MQEVVVEVLLMAAQQEQEVLEVERLEAQQTQHLLMQLLTQAVAVVGEVL